MPNEDTSASLSRPTVFKAASMISSGEAARSTRSSACAGDRSAAFSVIAMPLPQQARLAIGPAVAERRKHQRHRGQAVEIGHEIVEVAVVRPDHANLAGMPQDRAGILKEPRRWNQDCATAG